MTSVVQKLHGRDISGWLMGANGVVFVEPAPGFFPDLPQTGEDPGVGQQNYVILASLATMTKTPIERHVNTAATVSRKSDLRDDNDGRRPQIPGWNYGHCP
jgi:hypothetical protein